MATMQSFGPKAVLALALWTVPAIVSTIQARFVWRIGTWADAMRTAMPEWYVWGLLAPFIIAADHRWLDGLPPTRRIAAHIPLGVAVTLVAMALSYAALDALQATWLPASPLRFFSQQSLGAAMTYAFIVGISVAISYAARARQREQEAARLALHSAQLETHLAEAKLRLLQAQLHPHFLFNAFNTISALTETDPRTARRTMDRLATLLRSSLDHAGRHEVTVREELRFLDDYLSIERLRFEDRLTIDVRVEDDVADALVPSFVLQPLVENAIRHGTGPLLRHGHVGVSVRCAAGRLALEVEDDGVGLPAGWRLEDHAGVGLSNIARRLDELYGAEHTFVVRDRAGGGVRVELSVPFRT
jgi:two-component system, LytTR family, sensor kinase